MATDLTELEKYLHDNAPSGAFSPCARYDEDADALTLFLSNEPEYRERLNSRVTIYRSMESDQIVGCRIKAVKSVLDDLGSFGIAITDGKWRLTMLFVALHGTFSTDEESRGAYRAIGHAISSATSMDVDLPEPCGA